MRPEAFTRVERAFEGPLHAAHAWTAMCEVGFDAVVILGHLDTLHLSSAHSNANQAFQARFAHRRPNGSVVLATKNPRHPSALPVPDP